MLPSLVAGHRRVLFARLIANGVAQAVAAVAAALLLRAGLDEVRIGAGVPALLPEAAGLCGAGLALWALRLREAADAERLAQDYLKSLRLALFSHLNALPSRVLQRRTRGVMMVRFVADLNAVGLWVGRGIARTATAVPAVIAALAALAWVSPAVGAAVTVIVAASVGIGVRVQEACTAAGLIVRAIGHRIAFTPPLIIDETEIAAMCDRFGRGLDAAWTSLRAAPGLAAE